jgi:hypothetical protein
MRYDFSHVDFGKTEVLRGLAQAYGLLIMRAREQGLRKPQGEEQPSREEEVVKAVEQEVEIAA